MEQPLIYDIQRYSIHDGKGIRTTVFFKGCPLRCLWCHNPESQSFDRELILNGERCSGCGACARSCGYDAIYISKSGTVVTDRAKCVKCGECEEYCLNDARSVAGRSYEIDELAREIEKDRVFYEQSGGGVTLSGGEVMAQPPEYIKGLVRLLHSRGISVNIDTCGYAPYERFESLLSYTDTFLYDIKAVDSALHERLTGVGSGLIIKNLKRLSTAGARIWLRLPLIDGANADEGFINAVIALLKRGVKVEQINLLSYHNTGSGKYQRLDREYDPQGLFKAPSADQLKRFEVLFRQNGFNVKTGG